MTDLSPAQAELAELLGVATEYTDWQGKHVRVPVATVTAVLAALGIDASTPELAERALYDEQVRTWRRTVPPCTVARAGTASDVRIHVPHGASVAAAVRLEDGGSVPLTQRAVWVEPRDVDGELVGAATFALPDLPLGWHVIEAQTTTGIAEGVLVVTPACLGVPQALEEKPAWGFMTQLYSVRSSRSWGLGDLGDLGELTSWSGGELDAGFLLVNPLHAAEPVAPMEPSPYLPVTRRFVNPVYIRVEDVPEYAVLGAAERARVDELAEPLRARNTVDEQLDRDAVWAAKREALAIVAAVPRSAAREAAFAAFVDREGEGLVDFATWCAFAETYGLPWSQWPEELQDPRAAAVRRARDEVAELVDFYAWLQWVLDEQLAAAQEAGVSAGMPLGIMHDLAVGVHPGGADAWALQDVLAGGVNVGAPPDAFNQQGQDWSQPPWRPDALAQLGYAPFRDMIRTVLRHAGGIPVDHVIGLFRLWWVPNGQPPDEGTYVRYDHEAMIGILALEAHRAGAVVVGEDLGNVEPWVRRYLTERGILGTSILWWEKDWDANRILRPEEWRRLCLATVTTHDLPPTAGYLAGEHIRIRDELGLLTRPVEEERRVDDAEREEWTAFLRELGLLPADAEPSDVSAVLLALHRFLAGTPSRLRGVALADAVGDRRAINQPGTHREYPNWSLPLSDASGQPVLLEDVRRSDLPAALARAVLATREAVGGSSSRGR